MKNWKIWAEYGPKVEFVKKQSKYKKSKHARFPKISKGLSFSLNMVPKSIASKHHQSMQNGKVQDFQSLLQACHLGWNGAKVECIKKWPHYEKPKITRFRKAIGWLFRFKWLQSRINQKSTRPWKAEKYKIYKTFRLKWSQGRLHEKRSRLWKTKVSKGHRRVISVEIVPMSNSSKNDQT